MEATASSQPSSPASPSASSGSSPAAEAAEREPLERLLADARVWRGRQTRAPHLRVLATGWPALDAALPGGGWPLGALTEVLVEAPGRGELSLLLPALARLTDARREDAWIAWVAPPHIPYAPALAAAGLRLERILVVNAGRDAAWAAEQTLRSGLCAAVIGWFERIDERGLRRLQLAAEEGGALGVAFRDAERRGQTSPAALRLRVGAAAREVAEAGDDGILVDVVKCRGGRPTRVLCRT